MPAGQYPEHSSPRIVRHGSAAPRRPSWRARSRAESSVEWRHSSALRTVRGAVKVSTGSTKLSVSQNAWPS